MSAPAVSVVIPSKNRRGLVTRAVVTALEQRDVDVQVIVVDDGSSDGTADAVRSRFGSDVLVLRNEVSAGVGVARNDGIAAADCDLIAFLDDDDVWAPDKLTRQLAELDRTGREWVYSGMVSVGPDLQLLHGVRPDDPKTIHRDLPVRNRLPSGPSNVVIRRVLLDEVGGFDSEPDLHPHEDWDLWIRVNQHAAPAMVDAPLVGHLTHGGNATRNSARMLHALDLIERRHADVRDGRPVDRAAVHRWIAGEHLRVGSRGPAIRAYATAIRYAPVESTRWALRALAPSVGPGSAYRRPPDKAWRQQAESWLAPLRDRLRSGDLA